MRLCVRGGYEDGVTRLGRRVWVGAAKMDLSPFLPSAMERTSSPLAPGERNGLAFGRSAGIFVSLVANDPCAAWQVLP